MALPLLAMGLMMGGAGWLNQRLTDQRQAEGAAKVAELLGTAPSMVSDESGGHMAGGSGLLGNIKDPAAQAKFAQGLLTLGPRQAALAAQMYGDLFGRVQQQGQFDTTLGQRRAEAAEQTRQFGLQESRLTGEAAERVRQFNESQANWQKQFDKQAEQFRQSYGIDLARLNIERGKANAAAAGANMPELPKGYMWTQSAHGTVAMPLPGTKDYADATGGEQALTSAQANIGRFLDVFAGDKRGPTGVRIGGTGTELTGEKAGELSTLRAKIVADVAKLRDMGVLQAGELERIEEQLTDPTGWASGLKSNSRIAKGYETLSGQFGDKLKAHRNSNPWLLPPPPPGAVIDGAGPSSKPAAAPIARATDVGGERQPAPPSAALLQQPPTAKPASAMPATGPGGENPQVEAINAAIWKFLTEPPPHRRARR